MAVPMWCSYSIKEMTVPKYRKNTRASVKEKKLPTTLNSRSDLKTSLDSNSKTSSQVENREEWDEELKRVHGGKIPERLTKAFLDRQWEIVKDF